MTYPSNKYHLLREKVDKAAQAIIGADPETIDRICEEAGLDWRAVSIEGKGCMITADCRMDRIDVVIKNGIAIKANQYKRENR